MRQIGSINSDEGAERFSDYLLTQGIGNMVEEGAGGAWLVWVENDDHVDRGRTELAQFQANPADPRYEAAGKAEKLRRQAEKAEQRRRKQFVDVRTRWSQPSQLARPVTIALAVISILVAVGTRLGEYSGPMMDAVRFVPVHRSAEDPNLGYYGTLGEAISTGQVWRLVTPIFLHFGIFHILFNMFVLFDLGSLIETRRGSLFLLLLVFVSAVLSNVAEYYLPNPLRPAGNFGGMSGVNYALFGYAWIKGRYQPHLGIGVAQQTITIMLVWLVLCFVMPGMNIANFAHLGGLLVGVAFAYVPYAAARLRRRAR